MCSDGLEIGKTIGNKVCKDATVTEYGLEHHRHLQSKDTRPKVHINVPLTVGFTWRTRQERANNLKLETINHKR